MQTDQRLCCLQTSEDMFSHVEVHRHELQHEETNIVYVHHEKTQISLKASAQYDQSLLCSHEEGLGP